MVSELEGTREGVSSPRKRRINPHSTNTKPYQLSTCPPNGEKYGDGSVISRRRGRLAQNGGEGGMHHSNSQDR